jgi:hypothetical protein
MTTTPIPPQCPRLTAELVPSTCWWSNLRSNMPPAEWAKCKASVRRRSGDRCELCGGRGPKWPVECHEVWGYNDVTQVQLLVGLIALCPPCYGVKHIGRTELVGGLERATNRLMVANVWTRADVELYLEGVWEVWYQRSSHEWTLDVSWLTTIGIAVPVIGDRPAR